MPYFRTWLKLLKYSFLTCHAASNFLEFLDLQETNLESNMSQFYVFIVVKTVSLSNLNLVLISVSPTQIRYRLIFC